MRMHMGLILSVSGLLLVGCPSSDPIGAGGAGTGAGWETSGGESVSGGAGPTVGGGDLGGGALGGGGAGTGGAGTGGGGGGGGGGDPLPCPAGVVCVSTFPFSEARDTAIEGESVIDSYDCAPGTNEGGNELVYRVDVPADGFLSAAVYDGAGVDIDVQIFQNFTPGSGLGCLSRGDHHAKADVAAGSAWVVVDTWVNGSGVPQPGPFQIDIGFIPVEVGPCELEGGDMARVGDGGNSLPMPATGPIVMEAHLVTQDEPAPFPATASDELAEHYALSQAETGLVMFRNQVWAPLEGGSFYGAGIGDPAAFPVVDEGYYVNMYWRPESRPPAGTKMILRVPGTDRAVVVAAGYETGPGDLSNVGGTTEETHFYLGTGHQSELLLGIAVDQSLPFGPRACND